MKFPLVLILTLFALFLFFACSGCGSAVTYYPNGRISGVEFTVLKSVTFASATTTEKGIRITKGTATVDDEAVQAITAGVVEGVVKSLKP